MLRIISRASLLRLTASSLPVSGVVATAVNATWMKAFSNTQNFFSTTQQSNQEYNENDQNQVDTYNDYNNSNNNNNNNNQPIRYNSRNQDRDAVFDHFLTTNAKQQHGSLIDKEPESIPSYFIKSGTSNETKFRVLDSGAIKNQSHSTTPVPFELKEKPCPICSAGIIVDYKNVALLSQFISPHTGAILPRRVTGACAKSQRKIAKAIKRARIAALLPFTFKHAAIASLEGTK